MNHKHTNKMNPKDSNVYRRNNPDSVYSTPSGSYLSPQHIFYKHAIPSRLETEIQNNLKGLRYE